MFIIKAYITENGTTECRYFGKDFQCMFFNSKYDALKGVQYYFRIAETEISKGIIEDAVFEVIKGRAFKALPFCYIFICSLSTALFTTSKPKRERRLSVV